MRATKSTIISLIRTTTTRWCRSAAAVRGRRQRAARHRRRRRPRPRRRRRASGRPRRRRPRRSPVRTSTATNALAPLPAPLARSTSPASPLERSNEPQSSDAFYTNRGGFPNV